MTKVLAVSSIMMKDLIDRVRLLKLHKNAAHTLSKCLSVLIFIYRCSVIVYMYKLSSGSVLKRR